MSSLRHAEVSEWMAKQTISRKEDDCEVTQLTIFLGPPGNPPWHRKLSFHCFALRLHLTTGFRLRVTERCEDKILADDHFADYLCLYATNSCW